MKQTAVNWLIENSHVIPKTGLNKRELINQAKEMEKEQIIEAASDHCYPTCESARFNAEEYYKETFKSE